MCFFRMNTASDKPRRQPATQPSGTPNQSGQQKPPVDQRRQPHQRVAHVDDLIESPKQQIFFRRSYRGLLIAFPMPMTSRQNRESLESKSQNARSTVQHPASSKIEYFLKTTYALSLSGLSAFFPDDQPIGLKRTSTPRQMKPPTSY